jgi:hypothetical protein
MPLDWSILNTNQPVDIGGNFARGYQIGQAIVDKYHERNALAALAQTPNDPTALATLYKVNPTLGAHFEDRGRQLAATQRRATIAQQYAGGDTTGARVAALGAGDIDLAEQLGKLDDATKKQAVDFWEKAGPIAYKLKQTPDPAQRQALWSQAKPILQSEGIDSAQLDKFDPTNEGQLDAAITMAQKVGDLASQGKIEWHQQGENPSFATDAMGHPIGTQNPAIPAAAVPPVTATDKSGRKVQFNPQSKAWEPLGGAGGNASGGFP